MNEGKKLLYLVIEYKITKLSNLDTSSLFTDGINIKELSELLNKDDINFSIVTDNLIDRVIEENRIKNVEIFRKNIKSIRDLIVGKKDYNLQVNLTQEYSDTLKTFKKNLDKIVKKIDLEIINKDEKISKIKELKKCLDNNLLINDFELIESLTNDYDNLNYDKNMVVIMKYVNEFNLNLLKIEKKNSPLFDIQMIKKPKIDVEIKEIFKKLDIKQKEIPNYLLSEIKKCDIKEFIKNYNTIRKNKAESGGILHFIEKENKLLILAILLYSTPESIKNVISSVKDENGLLDVSLLKLIINKIPSALLIKNNTYYITKNDDYMKNYHTLKKLEINYSTLIRRCPLFMIIENNTLEYTLDYLNKNGALKKDIINRCYKTLSIRPSLLIDNLEIMKKHNINIDEFFSKNNTNYNLLKITDLDKKLNYLKNKLKVNFNDLSILNKIIISKVYRDSSTGYINWGDK